MHSQAVGLSALAFVSAAMVWSGPVRGDEPAPVDWTGYYIGAHMGSGHLDTDVGNPYGQSIFGGRIPTQEALVGLQGGYNWHAPDTRWVFGAEGDLTFFDQNGTNTCFAINNSAFTNSTCSANPLYLGTLAGRFGYAAGPSGKSLLYLKVGTAFMHNRVVADTNNTVLFVPPGRTTTDATRWGLVLGSGLEQAIAPAWSVKFEYDFVNIGNGDFSAPATYTTANLDPDMTPVAGRATHVSHMNHLFKVGLNYRFGEDPLAASSLIAPVPARRAGHSGWSFEPVLRYWHSTGRFQKDIPRSFASTSRLISRLTYDGLTANSNEIAARLDTPWHVFLKGLWGYGRIIGGHLNDEDWGVTLGMGYSNTLSILRDSGQRYSTIDGGFEVLRGAGYDVGVFAGYNHVLESYGATSCISIAYTTCDTPIVNTAIITETDKWDSLRIGVAANWWLTEGLKFNVDAAYLPYVRFTGIDNHWNIPLIANEQGKGRGTQIEAILSYYFTDQFSLGLGARYWSMWTTSGTDAVNKRLISRNDTFMYERYGVLAEATYRFD